MIVFLESIVRSLARKSRPVTSPDGPVAVSRLQASVYPIEVFLTSCKRAMQRDVSEASAFQGGGTPSTSLQRDTEGLLCLGTAGLGAG